MIIFHRFLIGTAILFFAGFGVWAILQNGAGLLALGAGSLLVAAGLSYYLKNLKRFLGR